MNRQNKTQTFINSDTFYYKNKCWLDNGLETILHIYLYINVCFLPFFFSWKSCLRDPCFFVWTFAWIFWRMIEFYWNISPDQLTISICKCFLFLFWINSTQMPEYLGMIVVEMIYAVFYSTNFNPFGILWVSWNSSRQIRSSYDMR